MHRPGTSRLARLGISQYRLAQATGLPQTRISQIVHGKRAITTDTALRLSKALGVDDRFWINIQTDYDLEVERDLHADDLARVTALVRAELGTCGLTDAPTPAELAFEQFSMGASITTTTCSHLCT